MDKKNYGMLASSLEENINKIKAIFAEDDTITFRDLNLNCGKDIKCCLIYFDPMVKREVISEFVIQPIINYEHMGGRSYENTTDLIRKYIVTSAQLEVTSDINNIITKVLYGFTLLLIDGMSNSILINTIGWKTRSIEEPTSETVIRGPREGFTEAMETNISLIRRRLRVAELKFKFMEIGTRTKTVVCICYLEDIALKPILEELVKRLEAIDIDGVLDSNYIEELIGDEPWFFIRTIGSSERPDVITAKLLEGRIAIMCDGSPVVLTVPFIFNEALQASEDYYNNFIFSSLNRILRWMCFILTTSVPAVYISLINFHQELVPTSLLLSIAAARQGVPFPSIVEGSLMLIVFELLREAGIRIPKHVGQTVSIVGAIVVGEAAVNARLVSAPMVIVAAITGIAGLAIPKMLSIVVVRFSLLLLSAFTGLYGFIFGVLATCIYFMSVRSFGVPFMQGVGTGPIDLQSLKDTAVRAPIWLMKLRPARLASDRVRSRNKAQE